MGSDKFYHIAGANNPADLLTRGNVDCCDVSENSRWQKGEGWMRVEFKNMPLKSYQDLCAGLTNEDSAKVKSETHPTSPNLPDVNESESEFHLSIFTDPEEYELCLSDCKGESCLCENIFDDALETDEDLDANTASYFEEADDTGEAKKTVETKDLTEFNETFEADEDIKKTKKEKIPDILKVTKSSIDSEDNVDIHGKYLVDFVKHGFEKSFRIITIIFRYFLRLRHKAHLGRNSDFEINCKMCCVKKEFKTNGLQKIQPKDVNETEKGVTDNECETPVLVCSPLDSYVAWHFICKIGTLEVKDYYRHKPDKLKDYTEKDGVLFGAGRLSHSEVKLNNQMENPLFKHIDFFQPVFLNSSTVTYALCMHAHWKLCPHSGIDRTMTFVSNIVHVEKLRKIVKHIRETCLRCRFLVKKFLTPITGNQAMYSLMRAPPFFSCMIDVAGPYAAHDSIKKRVTQDAYFLIQVCMVTGATAIGVMESLSITSVIMALTRSGSRYGWSKYILLDNQSSFKSLANTTISYRDLQGKLWTGQKVILDFSTPLAHNEHGRVEVKVRALREFLNKSVDLQSRFSFLEWESIAMSISATINGLPICHSQDDRGVHNDLGLLTPNMFLIGRNSNRSPDGFMKVEHNPSKALRDLAETDQKLFNLLGDYVHRFVPGRKLLDGEQPEVDDIVLFVSKESERSRNTKFKFGRIVATMVDGRQNKVRVQYQNATEAVKRIVERSVKDLVLIKGADEIDFNCHEHQLASAIQQRYL